MKIIHTNGKNSDFILLCNLLDASLDELVGNQFERKKYHQFNQLNAINNAVILYLDDNPVASGGFKHYEDGIAEIKRVFVKKEFRGRGLSKIVMEELIKKAKSTGYKKLYLETGAPLRASINLYKSFGFKKIKNYGPYELLKESICMEKSLL